MTSLPLAPPELKALHPFQVAPVLDDESLRLAESGAIVENVIRVHGSGRLAVAPGARNYVHYLYWWHFANASLVPAALIDGFAGRIGRGDDPVTRSLRDRLNKAYGMVETRLSEARFFGGEEPDCRRHPDGLSTVDNAPLFRSADHELA